MTTDLNGAPNDAEAPAGGSTEIAAAAAREGISALPAGTTHAQLFAALQASTSSSRTAPACRMLSTFPRGLIDSDLIDGNSKNRLRMCCLKEGCGSLILLESVAEMKPSAETGSVPRLDLPDKPPHPLLPTQAPEGVPEDMWLAKGSAMIFENVSFTRAVDGTGMKYLACGECELGPIGWMVVDQHYWIVPNRVGYR